MLILSQVLSILFRISPPLLLLPLLLYPLFHFPQFPCGRVSILWICLVFVPVLISSTSSRIFCMIVCPDCRPGFLVALIAAWLSVKSTHSVYCWCCRTI